MSDTSKTTTAAPTVAATTAPTVAATTTVSNDGAAFGIVFLLFLGIIIIVSIYCLVKSFLCFGKSGSTAEKILGVVIAFFTGPFYLLYLNFNTGYCNDEEVPAQMPAQMQGGRRK